ncbi:MAG: Flp pilus assembly protein TadB [Pseudohongiellaceae bacterium]|jgi:Flp pilus assembly protein TadB
MAGAFVIGVIWLATRVRVVTRRARTRERLEIRTSTPSPPSGDLPRIDSGSLSSALRLVLVPLLPGLALASALIVLARMSPELSISLGLLVATIAWLVDALLRRGAIIRVETQLAESLDLSVSALAAGAGPTEAFDMAAREAPQPLRTHLAHLTDRLRLGEGPEAAFLALERSLPLESVRMLRLALSAHWEGGGSMGRTIASVARATRDRVALVRRVQGQSAEAQASVLGVIAVTYLLAGLMWSMDPERVGGFLDSGIGSWAAPASVLLQVFGLFWMMKLTEVEA